MWYHKGQLHIRVVALIVGMRAEGKECDLGGNRGLWLPFEMDAVAIIQVSTLLSLCSTDYLNGFIAALFHKISLCAAFTLLRKLWKAK